MSDAYERVTWRGRTFDKRTVAAIRELERRLGKRVTIYQGPYSSSVGASAGTHSGGGAVDWWVTGVDPNKATRVARNVGWADWWRKPLYDSDGNRIWGDHHHGILLNHKTASDGAKWQMMAYRGGRSGLASNGSDPQPYRPNPIPVFDYAQWKKDRRRRHKVRELTNDILALKDRLAAKTKKRKRLLAELEKH